MGDPGLVMDPTGQGVADAFRDAELLSAAVAAGRGGGARLDEALAGYRRARDEAARAMDEFTNQLVAFAPPKPEERLLFTALRGRRDEISRILGVMPGAAPTREYFAPGNLLPPAGLGGTTRAMLGRLRPQAHGGCA